MKVKLLYFAALRESLHQDEEELEQPTPLNGEQLLKNLQAIYPDAAAILAACSLAQDEEYSPLHQEIREGAIVALIPPVSGG